MRTQSKWWVTGNLQAWQKKSDKTAGEVPNFGRQTGSPYTSKVCSAVICLPVFLIEHGAGKPRIIFVQSLSPQLYGRPALVPAPPRGRIEDNSNDALLPWGASKATIDGPGGQMDLTGGGDRVSTDSVERKQDCLH